MGADVEYQVAGFDETAVEAVHVAAPCAAAVIDPQRPHDAAHRPPPVLERHARVPAASSTAGKASAAISGGGAVSSGRRQSPIRTKARPSHGEAVTTASGIDSSGPPPTNSA